MYFYIFVLCVNTRTSRIKTHVFFDFIDVQVHPVLGPGTISTMAKKNETQLTRLLNLVREVLVIHVVLVTASTDHIVKLQARITVNVACIRTCLFFLLGSL